MLKKYYSYKDSGIDWIGEIPDHWQVKKLKYLCSLIADKVKCGDINYVISLENIESWTGKIFVGQIAPNIEGDLNQFRTNDILFNKLRPYLAKVVLADRDGGCIGELLILRPVIEVFPKFLFYRLISEVIINVVDGSTFGTKMPRASWGNFISHLKIPICSIEEQTQIAQYLDHKTSQIDKLITDKEKLIELLYEERTAIINQAVTRGLNPDVPMKDSGIEWLGEVPEHWEVKRLKHLLQTPLKYGANEPAEDDNPENPRYIRITDFGNDGALKDETFKSLAPNIANDYLLEEGDILFARSGATVGKTFHFKGYRGKACFAGYLIKANVDTAQMISDFLYYFTRSSGYDNWKQSIFQQATIQNIGADKYNQLVLAVPSLVEQSQIVQFINDECIRIESIIQKVEQEIQLLKEYKTALISEVVTGKVDVRDEVIAESTELVS